MVTAIIHGDATGADTEFENWALSRGIPEDQIKAFPAKWNDLTHPNAVIKYRRNGQPFDAAAGPRRNEEMAQYLDPAEDAVVIFPGGDGTADMYQAAKRRGLKIYDFR
jgi:hypothetical protein